MAKIHPVHQDVGHGRDPDPPGPRQDNEGIKKLIFGCQRSSCQK